MSTRKTPVALATKVETPTRATTTPPKVLKEEKEEIVKPPNDLNKTTDKIVNEIKSKTDTENIETSSPTSVQKEGTKTSGGNSRVTRNSPLLVATSNAKKDQLNNNADSEPTNSESEDGSSSLNIVKKIRGRKSIKEGKEATKEESAKSLENSSKPKEQPKTENQDKDLKSTCEEESIASYKNVDEKGEKDCKHHKEKDVTDLKEGKQIDEKNTKILEEFLESKDNKERCSKEGKETKDKDTKEAKDCKDSKDVVNVHNRLTRHTHAVAQEAASNTRMTRNRQSSGTSTTRPETPPISRRGRTSGYTRKALDSTANQKRKRSIEEVQDSLNKVIKMEPKDISDNLDDEESNSLIISSATNDLESVKIKQELIENEEDTGNITISADNIPVTTTLSTTNSMSTTTSITTSSTVTNTTSGRGRGNRWTSRKPTQTASPTTRSTRQSKGASPVPSISSSSSSTPEAKRRRIGGAGGATIKRSASTTLLKVPGNNAVGTNSMPDEDSKDSIASSMDDILLTDVKLEKLIPDLDEGHNNEMEEKNCVGDNIELKDKSSQETVTTNGIIEPLTIETESLQNDTKITTVVDDDKRENIECLPEIASTSASASSHHFNKDASLSPEMISEGVSEISVKQFYNKPNFLENNLGIEKDPKLGEIVQKATINLDDVNKEINELTELENENADNQVLHKEQNENEAIVEEIKPQDKSFSTESLEEGDLLYEESNDSKKTVNSEENIKLENTNLSGHVIFLEKNKLVEEEKSKDTPMDIKGEDESFNERLAIEEDLEDDDVTVEESESVSMDNNPSIHDDAAEEERDVEQTGELLSEIVDDLAQDGEVIKNNEIIVEAKETTNECDNEKAKLLIEIEVEDIEKHEQQKEMIEDRKETKQESIISIQNDQLNDKIEEKATEMEIIKKSEISIEGPILLLKGENELNGETITLSENNHVKGDDKIENCVTDIITVEDTYEKQIQENNVKDDLIIKPMEVDEIKPEDKEEINKNLENNSLFNELPLSSTVTQNGVKQCFSNSDNNMFIKTTNNSNLNIKDDDDANSLKSTKSTDANSWTTVENDYDEEEKLRQKEQHLQNLGLLTHKAAEKRRQEFNAAANEASRAAGIVSHYHGKRGSKSTLSTHVNNSATSHEYTGTLKTVIKLNRNSSGASSGSTTTATATSASTSNGSNTRKSHGANARESSNGVRRQSLKMTFQKGRGRGHYASHGTDRNSSIHGSGHSGDTNDHGEDSYYTIQNENEGAHRLSGGTSTATITAGTKDQQFQKQLIHNNTSNVQTHGRKPYNSRSNTTTSYHHHHNYHLTKNSHIDSSNSESNNDHTQHHGISHSNAGMNSHKKDDREEILIPEKASSFKFHPGRLCEDQCYYCSGKFGLYDTPCHVGQIKSIDRQQKILKNEEKLTVDNCLCDACFRHVDRRANVPSYKKRLSAPGNLESGNGANADGNVEDGGTEENESNRKCVVPDCGVSASHSLRRKCIRKSVKKFLLNFDMPTGSPYIWLCQTHYDAVIQCSGCVLCKRRLGKNHMYHITSDTERLEKALTDMGIPVQLGIGTAVCKLCRYFANLLMKPPDSTKYQKTEFVKKYRKRLLQFHNIHDGSNDASEADEDESHTKCTTASTISKENKTNQSQNIMEKEQINLNDNAVDEVQERSKQGQQESNLLENDVLLEYGTSGANSGVDTSNENSKSPSPNDATENETHSSRLKAILQNSGGNAKGKSTTGNDLPCAMLLSNPNLSMRELFPGEEDLGLHFKAPFGSSNSQRTPEGWTRVQTFLQYDEPTRRLWEDLQKPYGNQSSFLRHLILLEKYYRNGDLILSPNASSNASVYTQTVRQRLTSYDQGHCGGLNENTFNTAPSAVDIKEKPNDIPLVEINDDEEEENKGETPSKTNENKLNVVENVAMQDNTVPNVENTSIKRRSRSASVEKLTKHLSNNAVTIIARPKETAPITSTGLVKNTNQANNNVVEKRQELPKAKVTANSPIANCNTNPIATLAPLSTKTTVSLTTPTFNLGGVTSNNTNNSRSILKSNLLGISNNKNVEILPITTPKANTSNTITATTVTIPSTSTDGNTITKQQKILDVANKLLGNKMEAVATTSKQQLQNASLLTSPPELVSFQRRSLPNINSTTNVTNTTSISSSTVSLINAKRPHLMPNRQSAPNRNTPSNVVILPDTLSSHERAESKSWRPTLMSVEENQHLLNKNGPLYQTADGRRLPGLVQVQSGGKPFLISIFDYNRMCILRREKLLRDQMLKAGKHNKSHQQQHQQQRNVQQNSNFNKQNNSNTSNNNGSNTSANSNNNCSKQAQAAAAQQQLMQLLQFQKHQQQQVAALKVAASNSAGNRYQNIAPKPQIIAGNNNVQVNMIPASNIGSNPNNSMNSRLNINQTSFPMPMLANALSNTAAVNAANAVTLNSNSWLWSNFPDAHELLRSGAQGIPNKMPPLMPKPATITNTNLPPSATVTSKQLQQQQQQQQQHQLMLDNALISKIPKSLTVIPQHKLMGNNASSGSKE